MAKITRHRNLTREEELAYTRAWRDHRDENARRCVMDAYHKKAVHYAMKYFREHPGMSLEDLIQESKIGLMRALDGFDPELGNRFSTFCHYYILSALQTYTLDHGHAVRIFNTTTSKALLASYAYLKRQFEDPATGKLSQEGRNFICEHLKINDEELMRFEATQSVSIEVDVGAGLDYDEDSYSRSFSLLAEGNPESLCEEKDSVDVAKSIIAEAFSCLDKRDAEIMRRRYLLDQPQTLDVVGLDLGISRERVRQLELRSLKQIRDFFQKRGITTSFSFFDK